MKILICIFLIVVILLCMFNPYLDVFKNSSGKICVLLWYNNLLGLRVFKKLW